MQVKSKRDELIESNQALVHFIVNTYFPFIKKYSQDMYDETVANGTLCLVIAADKYIASGDTRPFVTYASRAIINDVRKRARDNKRLKRNEGCRKRTHSNVIDTLMCGKPSYQYIEDRDECEAILKRTKLDDRSKEIMNLFYYQDMSYEEIATKTQLSIREVKNCLQSIRIKLRQTTNA